MIRRARVSVVLSGLLLVTLAGAVVAHWSPRERERAHAADPPALTADALKLAERIYRQGILPSGAPLRAVGAEGELVGAAAACVQCHRRSGMGLFEGNRIIPPIAGRYLQQPRTRGPDELDARHTRGPDLAHAIGRSRAWAPYTQASVRRALTEGIDATGRRFDALMPRYALDEHDARLLGAYLAQLGAERPAGVTPDTLHFATVVTPDVPPAKRAALLDVLAAFCEVRNAGRRLDKLRERRYAGSSGSTYREWQLHVWELTGPPETWPAQLDAAMQRQPVFALLSGIATETWAPVQQFCAQRGVPCWFPTVDLPPTSHDDFYSIYFSDGVTLEAGILARIVSERRPRRVIQLRGQDVAAAGAAQAVTRALGGGPVASEVRVLDTLSPSSLRRALADVTGADAVVAWLRGGDLATLGAVPPPPAPVYFSATLAGDERARLPSAWKGVTRLAYPFELPARRRANVSRFETWLQTRGLPRVDERVQAEAYLTSMLMAEKVDEILEELQREYLLERAEGILATHATTAIYRGLSLGPGQRVASKGGYVVRFGGSDGESLVADSDWIVP
jgi:cytochrome c553